MAEPCEACKTIPPVISEGYELKGSTSDVGGLKTYITGSSSAKTGVLSIYDIFGFFPQTQQGADIIASAGHLVVMPDMFEGTPLDINVYPPNTDEKKAAMQKFWVEKALPPGHIERVKTKIVPALKERFPSVEKWAVIGYCWGGKVSTLLSSEGTPFIASIQAHPALMDVEEAKQIVIPHLCIATADEKADVTKEYGEILKAKSGVVGEKSKVLYWGETFHGVMAARSNLKDEKHFEYYTKGYQEVVNFLASVFTKGASAVKL